MLTSGARHRAGEVLLIIVVVTIDLFVSGSDRVTRSGDVLPWTAVPLLVVLVHATLLLRWRRPGLVLLVQCCLGLIGILLPDAQLFMGILVALHAVARTSPRGRSVVALCACPVVLALYSVNSTRAAAPADRPLDLVISLVLWMAMALAVWGFGRVALITQPRAEREQEARALEVLREERLSLARELHDIISAGVSAMLLQATGARGFTDGADPRVARALEVIEGGGAQTMDELHQLLGLLRATSDSPAGAWDAPRPRLAEMPYLVARAREAGLDSHLLVHGDPVPVDPGVDLAGYRMVQEALTNAAKHAGAGASVTVELTWGEHLEVSVRDTGGDGGPRPGVAPQLSSGHGLEGLAERVGLAGGHLESAQTPHGYLVRAEPPVRGGGPAVSGPALSGPALTGPALSDPALSGPDPRGAVDEPSAA